MSTFYNFNDMIPSGIPKLSDNEVGGQFTKRLISLMKVVMKRQEGPVPEFIANCCDNYVRRCNHPYFYGCKIIKGL